MIWLIIIIGIVIYMIWKFQDDSKEVQQRNQSFGGMKKLFPEFVYYFEKKGMELVEDTGTRLTYRLSLTDNPSYNKYLFLGVESKFTNVAFGYVITPSGERISGLNVEFRKNYRPEEVDMVIRRITGELDLRGII